MPLCFQTPILTVVTLAIASTGLVQETAMGQEIGEELPLVPAALGIRTDRQGTSWNVEANGTLGRIGSTMVNSGLALKIDEESFAGSQPLMTSDGKEFVIPGRPFAEHPGLQVQRRIRLLEEKGILRYAEMLYNGSTDPISLTLSLHTNFSGNYQTFLTNRGRTEPVLLEEGETAVVVLPGVAQSSRAFLFSLAGMSSSLKPTLSAQNRYGLSFQYPLNLAPGETKIVVHQVAQVIIPQNYDRPNLIRLFRPYTFEETRSLIPEQWENYLANSGPTPEGSEPAPIGFRGIESLGIERGARDILAVGEKTRLLGTATGESAVIESPYGDATIPFAEIAALHGDRGLREGMTRIFLEDGQIFSARLDLPGLTFTQTGGDALPLQLVDLDRLVFAEKINEEASRSSRILVLETFRGDRIHVAGASSLQILGQTKWGRLPVSLDELVRLQPASPHQNGYWAELTDGTRSLVFLIEEEMKLQSIAMGSITLPTGDMRGLFSLSKESRPSWASNVGARSVIHLSGLQRFVCDLQNSTLPVISDGLRVEVPSEKIRRLERIDTPNASRRSPANKSLTFQVERWDGGVLNGIIDLDALAVEVRGQSWKIPLRDIVRLETPSPELTETSRREISSLIEQLGAPEWRIREEATRELGAFGYLAGPLLRSKLHESEDPEVTRRIERILAELN
ncbi:MAG: hypothetical protein AAF491_00215 [Verrucomicrobiota bacterium]